MEIKNMKTRMSQFWRDVISFVILVPLFVLNLKFDIVASEMWPSQFVFGIILGMLIFSKIALVHMELDEALNYKYKIIKKQYWYEAKVLRSWFWFIIFWQPIKEDYHSYKAQNIFGAKWDSAYTTDVTYKTEKEAREVVKKYKNNAKKQRQEYFTKKKIFHERIKV
jgi:hypothetical protein